VLDEEPEVSSLLAPPEPSLVERRSSLTKEEADETLEFANTLDYDELGDVSFVRTGAPVQSSPGDQLLQWYDEVNTMSPAPIKQRRVKSDNAFQSKAKSSVRQEEWDAQDTQMMLDNRRFYPDRVFAEGQAEKLWSYLGDDFLADGEGNPVVLFRTGSQLGEQGYPRAFGGGNEFSAHFGTRSAALNVQEFGRTMSFGGPGKYVDVYYTNVKAPFQVPDLGQWYSESVLSAVLRNTQATEGMKRELLKVQREYEEVARVVLQPTGIDTSRSTLNEMMLEMNEFNGKGLERTQTSLRAAMSKDIKRVLSDAGYDSLSYRNEHEGKGSLSFLPFSPNQVKSIKNVGTFNPRNENVLKSILGGTVVGAGAAEQQDTGGDT
tara:strand:+ start:1027 stop:2157 length:1131 start_codon:yes stop_codon:yes gene_type:complete